MAGAFQRSILTIFEHFVMRLTLTLLMLTLVLCAKAQFGTNPCVDENRIDKFFQCNDPTFSPVCGCNFVTYRSECVAFRNSGVNTIAYDGVCMEDFFFTAIYPNTVTATLNLYIQFYQSGPALIQVRDAYGKLMLSQNYLSIDSRQFTYYVSDYRPGMYFVFVISGGVFKIEKFVKL